MATCKHQRGGAFLASVAGDGISLLSSHRKRRQEDDHL